MLFSIPVSPDADTARQWAIDELSKSPYVEHGRPWFARAWDWFVEKLSHVFDFASGGTGAIAAVVAILVVAVVVFLIARATIDPVRRSLRHRRAHSVFEDDQRSASAMRAAADAAADAGDWPLAVLERFRAIVRSLEERDLLDDRPGVTADEAAVSTGFRFPDVASDMRRAADVFDGVRYGHRTVGAADDAALRDLDSRLAGRTLLSAVVP